LGKIIPRPWRVVQLYKLAQIILQSGDLLFATAWVAATPYGAPSMNMTFTLSNL
jgi:hypothetical protein